MLSSVQAWIVVAARCLHLYSKDRLLIPASHCSSYKEGQAYDCSFAAEAVLFWASAFLLMVPQSLLS